MRSRYQHPVALVSVPGTVGAAASANSGDNSRGDSLHVLTNNPLTLQSYYGLTPTPLRDGGDGRLPESSHGAGSREAAMRQSQLDLSEFIP